MDLELGGRTALVTGASVGIGRGIAKALAAEGVRLAITARRAQLLEELAGEIVADSGPRPLVLPGDLTARGMSERLRQDVLAGFGRLDILVNNAGGSRPMPIDATNEAWDEAFAIDFTAVRLLTHGFLSAMQEQRSGRIITITGSMEPKNLNAANAAKAAVHAWAKGLSREVGRWGITVNCVSPGRILSEQIVERIHPTDADRRRFAEANIPLGYFGEPSDVAALVVFLASPRARYISGEIVHVDGGLRRHAF